MTHCYIVTIVIVCLLIAFDSRIRFFQTLIGLIADRGRINTYRDTDKHILETAWKLRIPKSNMEILTIARATVAIVWIRSVK